MLELAQRALALAGAPGAGAGAGAAGLGEVVVERLTARCDFVGVGGRAGGRACGAAAPFSQRLSAGGSATVVVGGETFYAPACAEHHSPSPGVAAHWGRGGGAP